MNIYDLSTYLPFYRIVNISIVAAEVQNIPQQHCLNKEGHRQKSAVQVAEPFVIRHGVRI